jgi:hypothetical protein
MKENEHQPHRRPAERRTCSPPKADGSMRFWRMDQLWPLAENLPVKKVSIQSLNVLDEVCWFGGPLNLRPTCRSVANHARDIYNADLSYPIILSPKGDVLDGMHRIGKAYLLGLEEIDAVQLTEMPLPRGRLLPNGEEVPDTDQTGLAPGAD